MRRAVSFFIAALFWAAHAAAQPMGGMARLLPDASGVEMSDTGIEITIGLSQAVPFRVFTLTDPARVVVDFREIAFDGFDALFTPDGAISGFAAGQAVEPGWSRMIIALDAPLYPESVELAVDDTDAQAILRVVLEPVTAEEFAARTGPMPGAGLAPETTVAAQEARGDGARITLVLDPGHGGVDPGAVRGDVTEADLVLIFARELRDALRRTGRIDVVMTRDADVFVPLPTRVTVARAAEAHGFLSIHADALAEGRARGATVYTLSDRATDAAAEALAEQHDRADILLGIDLHGSDDVVAGVLMDLARVETTPRSMALADGLVAAIDAAGLNLHSRPRGEAGFTVLRAADIPSVLLEIGFMSDARDLENIRDPGWRAEMQAAIVQAVLAWADAEAARTVLLRQ